jgi:hypothetical protein
LRVFCQPSEHDADHGHAHEGCDDAGETMVVADPSVRALDNPALGQHDKAMLVTAAHDLDLPWAGAGDSRRHLRPLIAGIANDAINKREQMPGLAQQWFGINAPPRSYEPGDGYRLSRACTVECRTAARLTTETSAKAAC